MREVVHGFKTFFVIYFFMEKYATWNADGYLVAGLKETLASAGMQKVFLRRIFCGEGVEVTYSSRFPNCATASRVVDIELFGNNVERAREIYRDIDVYLKQNSERVFTQKSSDMNS